LTLYTCIWLCRLISYPCRPHFHFPSLIPAAFHHDFNFKIWNHPIHHHIASISPHSSRAGAPPRASINSLPIFFPKLPSISSRCLLSLPSNSLIHLFCSAPSSSAHKHSLPSKRPCKAHIALPSFLPILVLCSSSLFPCKQIW
jgi:hypothetical protein